MVIPTIIPTKCRDSLQVLGSLKRGAEKERNRGGI